MAEQTVATPDQSGAPSMTLGGEMLEYSSFLGTVITDAWELSDKGNWRWHLAVRPTDIPIAGETGAFHSWTNFSEQKNSALGAQREAMLECFPGDLKIGKGELVGQVAHWCKKDIKFGVNRQTGEEMIAKQVLMPLKKATPDEAERAASQGGYSGPAAPVEAASEPDALDDATLEKVLALVAGKTKQTLQIAATRDKTLPKEVKQGLLSGKLIDALIADGAITINDDYVYELI